MSSTLVRELLDAGVHFGHRASRWNPKMKPYIYGKRNEIHIVDIRETLRGMLRARKLLTRVVSNGGDVLFVGTKRQAREIVREHALRTKMHYVCERWLGGTLTNFRTIRSRLQRLEELEGLASSPEWETGFSKKMQSTLSRELRKIKTNLDGIRNMSRLPAALVLVDIKKPIALHVLGRVLWRHNRCDQFHFKLQVRWIGLPNPCGHNVIVALQTVPLLFRQQAHGIAMASPKYNKKP